MAEDRLFPREVVSNVPLITLTGRSEVRVEQHHGLITCTDAQIALNSASGLLTISGSGLELRQYSVAEALISGDVAGVSITPPGGKK